MALDPASIQAALLHDVPEDTDQSLTDIEEHFGPEVAHLVDGVTKLSKFSTHSHEEQQAENIRKMLLAMAEDIRVVLIKLADRLHNMRTLSGLPAEKQLRIARQTMEIYAPLAERLGIWQIKWELGGPLVQVPRPGALPRAGGELDTRRARRESYIERAIAVLQPELARHGIEGDLNGRPKHLFSIWKKMQAQVGGLRRDLRRLRHPPAGGRGPGLLRGARRCAQPLEADPGPVRRLHRGSQAERLTRASTRPVIALDGKPLGSRSDARDALRQRGRDRGPLALQGGSKAERDYDAKLAWLAQLMDWQREVSDATEFVEASSSTSSRSRVSSSRRRAISRICRRAPRRSTCVSDPHRCRAPTIGSKVNNRLSRSTIAEERRHRRDR